MMLVARIMMMRVVTIEPAYGMSVLPYYSLEQRKLRRTNLGASKRDVAQSEAS
jgi:hypothetical protein